jgi:deoxyinosine 3'endonuclease (endonuclease V)
MVRPGGAVVPSYLAYREMDAVIDLIDRQVKSRPDLTPDVILVDGNGVWHERKAGIATFVGVRTGLPTVGIGKTFYIIDGMMTRRDMHQRVIDALDAWHNEESMQERDSGRSIGATSGRGTRLANRRLLLDVVSTAPPAQSVEGGRDVTRRGLAVPVERILEALHQSANGIAIPMKDPRATAEDDDDDDEPLAYALVGHGGNNAAHRNGISSNPKYCARGSKNPIYISIGSNISLLDAVYLCSQSCVVRIPEPIREADSYCRRLVRERRKGLPTISNGD